MRYSNYSALSCAGILAILALSTSLNASAATPSQPTYTPLFKADFENGAVGNTVQEFANTTTPAKTTYDNSITGPLGGNRVIRQANTSLNKGFGGKLYNFNPNLGEGDEVWVRWYEYFPSNFIWALGTNGDGFSSAGIKWLRFQGGGSGGGSRLTLKPVATQNCTTPCPSGLTTHRFGAITGENVGWEAFNGRNYSGALNAYFSGNQTKARGQWLALQMYVRFSKGDAVTGDGNGLMRVWVNDEFQGEFQRNTLAPAGHSHSGEVMNSVWYGNYWNGGFPRDQHWFMDEVIITTDRPNTVDSGGRPFIHPQTRVADFGTISQTAPPNPPSGIN